MNSPSLNSSYLPHINGLRALAILGVLAYHLSKDYCPAGYFGVDLFLVISGFLLFRSLLKPGAETQFHYGSYLLKKAWRIIPPWFLVTLICCIAAFYLLPHHGRISPILKTARASALFTADFHIDKSGDYFNTYTQQNPLLHFWYLSVTQQLYIIAPLLIIPLARWCSRRAAAILLAVLTLLSLAYYLLTTSTSLLPDALRVRLLESTGCITAYYHLVPRFWEVAAGVGVFLLPEFGNCPRLRGLLGCLGLAGILASFYLYSTGSPAIYLTVVSSLLALRYAATGPAAWLLGLKPVQALGTISFSLYLWHWPIMVFWKYCSMDAPGPWDEEGMVAASLLLGTLSWWWIERLHIPSRTDWRGTLQRSLVVLLLPIILIGSTKLNKYARKHMPETDYTSFEGDIPPQPLSGEQLKGLEELPKHGMAFPPFSIGAADKEPSFLLIGDSHAYHLHFALHETCMQLGINGTFFGNSAQPIWYMEKPHDPPDPCIWNEGAANSLLNYLKAHPSIRCVLLAQLWTSRLRYSDARDWRSGKPIKSGDARLPHSLEGLRETSRQLKAIGVELVLLGDNPNFERGNRFNAAPLDIWERCQKLGFSYREHVISADEHEKAQECARKVHGTLAEEGSAHYIDLAPPLLVNGGYPARINGEFMYSDNHHFTNAGARRVVAYIMPRLQEILRHEPTGDTPAPQPPAE